FCVSHYRFSFFILPLFCLFFFFFFNDTATTDIYTLSLHDALPISAQLEFFQIHFLLPYAWIDLPLSSKRWMRAGSGISDTLSPGDRKSTRLNSSHVKISYAVFCLKKKKKKIIY